MNRSIINFMKLLTETSVNFFIFVGLTVFSYKFISGDNWVYSWEWFHGHILIYIIWYIAPLLVIITLIGLIMEVITENIPDFFKLKKYPIFLHKSILFIFISTFVATFSQLMGGCIWQIPLIIQSAPGYSWRRFGHQFIPDSYLILLYIIATTTLGVIIYHYYTKYIEPYILDQSEQF